MINKQNTRFERSSSILFIKHYSLSTQIKSISKQTNVQLNVSYGWQARRTQCDWNCSGEMLCWQTASLLVGWHSLESSTRLRYECNQCMSLQRNGSWRIAAPCPAVQKCIALISLMRAASWSAANSEATVQQVTRKRVRCMRVLVVCCAELIVLLRALRCMNELRDEWKGMKGEKADRIVRPIMLCAERRPRGQVRCRSAPLRTGVSPGEQSAARAKRINA